MTPTYQIKPPLDQSRVTKKTTGFQLRTSERSNAKNVNLRLVQLKLQLKEREVSEMKEKPTINYNSVKMLQSNTYLSMTSRSEKAKFDRLSSQRLQKDNDKLQSSRKKELIKA